jgi:hypothetical protein
MKYAKAIILIIIYFIMGSIPLFIIPESPAFAKILPGNSVSAQVTILFVLYPIVILIFASIFGYIMAPLALIFHKYIFGRNMTYGIYQRPSLETGNLKNLGKGFFPGLVAINIAIMLVPFLSPLLLYADVFDMPIVQSTFLGFIVVLVFTAAISSILFSGVWFLNDAGIGYSNRDKIKDTEKILEIRSCGGWYRDLLKGYGGIGAIFTYIILIANLWLSMEIGWMDPIFISMLFIIIPIPIYAAMAVVPTLILFEITKAHRIRYILNFAKKLGITEDMVSLI